MKFNRLLLALVLTCMAFFFSSWQQIIPASSRLNIQAPASDSTAPDFSYIDSFAMNAPLDISRDTAAIAAYLLKGCKNDLEKARAIFSWIANNIRYDDNAFNSGKIAIKSPTAILKTKHAVCEGYSALYKAIGTAMALEVQVITGYAKAYGYRSGERFEGSRANHVWNAVKVNGDWLLLDATWGAGRAEGSRGRLVSRKIFTPYWFNVNKYEFLFRHLPEDSRWQLLPQTVSIRQYDDMPLVPEGLFALGFDGHDLLDKAVAKSLPKEFPEIAPVTHHIKLIGFPLSGTLSPATEFSVSIICDEGLEFAISNDLKERPVIMKRNGNTYTASLPLKRGDLHVAVKEKGMYSDIMMYKVK